ncbi:patatin-like phospholipase family protein, putative [Ichthyophthirius multifiliis]|uniref:Patatin-like phospholipase family protein, putative n=1 Tax=Ichthyophthirius multifiliis TaxID=5932 RepID=G0QRG2_ICHMU|nr:patatin-like phospholipase family protein, putative [Ichthyophthirius multifiliis]EGR32197.1 patatin-like phospholipase family protein, putative [Ichthyophthirius multifiliis]|eukprot:XP_004035683.1 patatin-like phospholipase family protein, putative [Ichthyophthirius multifiliis]
MLIDSFKDENQFAEAVHCSCTIPGITGFQIWGDYQGLQAIDGGVTMGIPYKNKNSKCIFLNVLPKVFTMYPIIRESPKDLKTIYIAEEFSYNFPNDYWLWDEYNADKQFLQGYLAAKNHEGIIKEYFLGNQ